MENLNPQNSLNQEAIEKILRDCEKELLTLSLMQEDSLNDSDFKTRIFQFIWVKLAHAMGKKNNVVPNIYAGMPKPALEALEDLCEPRTTQEEEKKEIVSILKSWEADNHEFNGKE